MGLTMRRMFKFSLLLWVGIAHAGILTPKSDNNQKIIDAHYKKYANLEYFSGIQVSIQVGKSLHSYVSGRISREKESTQMTKETLFQIGSITKSFTASLVLMAERDKKMRLESTLADYLDNYPHWGKLSITSLLNMSNGLPNYSNSPKINYLFSQNLKQFWSKPELINLVYSSKFNPPLKSGYFYSNTGYILSAMILESRYKKTYKRLLLDKIITPLKLDHTFYPSPTFSAANFKRLAHGYNYNVYDNPELLGKDVTENNLSWAGAAGGLIANSEDVVRWVDALFSDEKFLSIKERSTLQQLVSLNTGKPIDETDEENPRGFGLGIIQAYDKELGHYWFYEGETLGYRALYLYSPCNKVIISTLFNSAVNSENDHAGILMKSLYQQLLSDRSDLRCKN